MNVIVEEGVISDAAMVSLFIIFSARQAIMGTLPMETLEPYEEYLQHTSLLSVLFPTSVDPPLCSLFSFQHELTFLSPLSPLFPTSVDLSALCSLLSVLFPTSVDLSHSPSPFSLSPFLPLSVSVLFPLSLSLSLSLSASASASASAPVSQLG